MGDIDKSFFIRKRIKIYRRCLMFFLGFGIVIGVACFYFYEWNRMPDVIYIQAGKEEVLDFNVPATGEIYKESIEAGFYVGNKMEDAVNLNSQETVTSLEVDFMNDVIMSGKSGETYCADLKLFGFLPYKTVRIRTMDTYSVIPSGSMIGIYIKMDGVYVIDTGEFKAYDGENVSPGNGKLEAGDYIIAVNGEEVKRKKDFTELVKASDGKILNLTVVRDDKKLLVTLQPVLASDGTYKIGAWIRDSLQGVGTMTFMDAEGNYAALGHGIRDMDTNELVKMSNGSLFETSIVSIHRGEKGEPGEITGLIQYEQDKIIGEISYNGVEGIQGSITNEQWTSENEYAPIPIGFKQDLELGEAFIISDVTGESEEYAVEIIDINYNNTQSKKSMTIKVTDERLLKLTGGIVQGMSGSPIVQNGRIVGAVTHVLVNDPEKGYGIFIENMLDH